MNEKIEPEKKHSRTRRTGVRNEDRHPTTEVWSTLNPRWPGSTSRESIGSPVTRTARVSCEVAGREDGQHRQATERQVAGALPGPSWWAPTVEALRPQDRCRAIPDPHPGPGPRRLLRRSSGWSSHIRRQIGRANV